MSKREKKIGIKLFDHELEAVKWLANKENLPVGTLVRKLLLETVEKKKKEIGI